MNLNPTSIQFLQVGNGIIFLYFTLFLLFTPYAEAQIESPAEQPPPAPAIDLDPKFKVSPSMAIILVCLFSAFFFMGCVSVGVRQCADSRMALSAGEFPGSGRRTSRTSDGLDQSVIDTFPMFLYSDVKGLKIGSTVLECAVCLNEFESKETLRLLPKCSHVFHPDCIDSWLACHVTCPVCRADLVPQPGEVRPVSLLPQDSDNESVNSYDIIINIESPQVINPTMTPNRNRPPRSTSKKLPRSYSADYSEVNSDSNFEKFTLRLPEEVRSQLMNSSLIRTRSLTFTRVRSSRKGYRSRSVGGLSQRFDQESQPDRWGLMKTPSIFSRLSSSRSSKMGVWDGLTGKSPLSCLGGGANIVEPGERSFERLKPGG